MKPQIGGAAFMGTNHRKGPGGVQRRPALAKVLVFETNQTTHGATKSETRVNGQIIAKDASNMEESLNADTQKSTIIN